MAQPPGDTPLDLASVDTLMRELARAPEEAPPLELGPGLDVFVFGVAELARRMPLAEVIRSR